MQFYVAVDEKPHPACPYCESCPPHMLSAGIWTVYMIIVEDQLIQATKVVHFIAAEGTGCIPPLVLNLELEGTHRVLEMTLSIGVWAITGHQQCGVVLQQDLWLLMGSGMGWPFRLDPLRHLAMYQDQHSKVEY